MASPRFQKLVTLDESLSARFAEWGADGWPRAMAWILARTGDSIFWLVVSGILIWRESSLGWNLLVTVAISAVLTAAAKGVVRRERPSERWAISTDKYAFPSGHASRAGAVAVALSFAFPEWTAAWFLWAVLVCIARVVLARHYVSDVIAGLLFGIVIGLMLQILLAKGRYIDYA